MARQPGVFVHELEPEQTQRLVKITRTTRDQAPVASRRDHPGLRAKQPASEIAVMFAAGENYVREVIHAFNQSRFAALDLNGAAAGSVSSGQPPEANSLWLHSVVGRQRSGEHAVGGADTRLTVIPRPSQ
jgi:hypothetical protein